MVPLSPRLFTVTLQIEEIRHVHALRLAEAAASMFRGDNTAFPPSLRAVQPPRGHEVMADFKRTYTYTGSKTDRILVPDIAEDFDLFPGKGPYTSKSAGFCNALVTAFGKGCFQKESRPGVRGELRSRDPHFPGAIIRWRKNGRSLTLTGRSAAPS